MTQVLQASPCGQEYVISDCFFYLFIHLFCFLISFSVYLLISFRGGYKRQEGKIQVTGVDTKSAAKAETLFKNCSFRCMHRIRSGLNEKWRLCINNSAHVFFVLSQTVCKVEDWAGGYNTGSQISGSEVSGWQILEICRALEAIISRPLKCVKGV